MLVPLRHTRQPRIAAALWMAAATASIFAFPPASVKSPVPIDFSYAGYEGGRAIPSVKAALRVEPSGGDDTALIQGALDRVAALPKGADGFCGAVLLTSGHFRVTGQIHLRASGVVLRGSGSGASGTVIVAEGIGRRPLIAAGAEKDVPLDPAIAVKADVPVGGQSLELVSITGLQVGDHVVVRRPSTLEWINALGMTGLPGTFANQRLDRKPGSHAGESHLGFC